MTRRVADIFDVNANNRSSWFRRWLSKPAGYISLAGLLLGGAALGDDAAWRASGSVDPAPDVLPPNLPISPLAPRPDEVVPPTVDTQPMWQARPSDSGLTWSTVRPTITQISSYAVESAPMPRLAATSRATPVTNAVRPVTSLVQVPVEQLLQLLSTSKASTPPPPAIVIPPTLSADSPSDVPKFIPPATDDPAPGSSFSKQLPPPKQMQPKRLPPIEPHDDKALSLTQPSSSQPSSQVWGVTTPSPTSLGPIQQLGHDTPPAMLPNKPGQFGSPNLTLTRDRQLLDLFQPRLGNDHERVLFPDGAASERRTLAQAEYLLWWVNAGAVPVLAATGRTLQSTGYLGQPGTEVLLGPGNFGSESRNGFRTRFGTSWETPFGERGLDMSCFVLGRQTSSILFDSSQYPTITRPFFAPNFNSEFAQLVAFPGLSTGALRIDNDSQLWGSDVNYRWLQCHTCDTRSEWFAGYRHLNLRESLQITEFIVAGPNAPDPVGTAIVVADQFITKNFFHGAQLGWSGGRTLGAISWDLRAALALGVTQQELNIRGDQIRQRPGERSELFTGGGLLAAGPNIGQFRQNRFSTVTEATFNLGYAITPVLRATLGYNVLYWSNVLRPGEQIDRVVDLTFVPNSLDVPRVTRRPLPLLSESGLWVHGLQFGLEARW